MQPFLFYVRIRLAVRLPIQKETSYLLLCQGAIE